MILEPQGNLQSLVGGLRLKVRIQHPGFTNGPIAAARTGFSATGKMSCNRTAPRKPSGSSTPLARARATIA